MDIRHWEGFKWISGMFAFSGILFAGYGAFNFSALSLQHVLAVLLYFSCALLALNLYVTIRFAKEKGCKVVGW